MHKSHTQPAQSLSGCTRLAWPLTVSGAIASNAGGCAPDLGPGGYCLGVVECAREVWGSFVLVASR